MPTYGYRRVHAIMRRNARADGCSWPNAKRVYRVMKLRGLLLERHTGDIDARRHEGKVAVERSNLRWWSDGFEMAATTGRRSASGPLSTAVTVRPSRASPHPKGSRARNVQALVITAVENRFGGINILPKPSKWLTDNGSCFIAKDTKSLLRDSGIEPCPTPVRIGGPLHPGRQKQIRFGERPVGSTHSSHLEAR